MKKALRRLLSFALMSTFVTSLFLSDQSGKWTQALNGDGSDALFTDVTGSVDFSDIVKDNLSSSVLTNQKSYERRTVIVSLEGDALVKAANGEEVSQYARSAEGVRRTKVLENYQDNFLKQLSSKGIAYTLENRYTAIDNAVAIEVNTKYVSYIKEMKGVESAFIAGSYAYPETTGADYAVTNETSVYETGVYDSSSIMEKYGYTGDGSVVAIVDTGLDYTHNAFQLHDEYTLDNAVLSRESVDQKLNTLSFNASIKSALSGDSLDANDVYLSKKVPFAYDYADNDADVYPSYSNHGTHVAGIVGGYDPDGYTDKDGNHIDTPFTGVAPESQLVICKVFTDDLDDPEIGGAESEDIMAALEDCVLLGVDVINMSLGTSCGFTTTDDGDDEGEHLNEVYDNIRAAGISLVCAASNDYSAGFGGDFGTNLASNPDSGTVGSPSTFAAALSVASISGQRSPYMLANEGTTAETAVFYEESSDENNQYFDFAKLMLGDSQSGEYEYVSVPGVGRVSDYSASVRSKFSEKPGQRIALIKRGDINFKDKVEIAKSMGAKAVIVYNNVAGTIRMSLGEVEDPIPSVSVSMDAGKALADYAASHGRVGKVKLDKSLLAGPFMSDFSSWGCTPDLKLKPEITAHGGEITSAVPGGYDELSGTSMASPNMAGLVSIVRSYLKETHPMLTPQQLTQRINQLVMSTATIVYDREGFPYSPRKQGAGLGSLENTIASRAYLSTDSAENDYRPKVELGDDKEKRGVYEVAFNVTNFGTSSLAFNVKPIFITETLASDGFAVAEQAYILDDIAPTWTISGASRNGDTMTVEAGQTAKIKVTLTLSEAEKKYLDDSFKNGMFVEGFISLESLTDGQCGLTLPFMGFYGDWSAAPMLDYSEYEIAASAQDTSIDDNEKLKASVWGTQPYVQYYNEKYVIPMGSFAYLQDENADQMYTSEEHNAISRFNQYYGEDNQENYLTSYKFKGLYVGLLRNARSVEYVLKNAETGEIIYSDKSNRIGKAFAGGGSARPGFVEFDLDPQEYGLVTNGKYTMDFTFLLDYENGEGSKKNTYSFSFYADYDAPVMQDARVRYYDYKDGNQDKQRIYLDIDVYDNHYPQSVILCYYDDGELKQVEDYVTPVRNAVKNGTNTVSIEITDIYDEYKDKLYLQVDDYALNHSVYYLNLNARSAQATPDSFELAAGEEALSLDIYETHKVSLVYEGNANISNFFWSSANRNIADVKNGEIVGLKAGTTKITVTNGKGDIKTITVTVSDRERNITVPSLSFGTIIDGEDNIVKASGTVSVYPDQSLSLNIVTDPWYYPKDKLNLLWESGNEDIATVDQNGNVELKKEGSATIKASILDNAGNATAYSAVVMLRVKDPFVVSNFTLTHYRGKGGVVNIPTDKTIMYIGEDAFEDNDTMTEVIIPKSVVNINEGAFRNCTALKKVYFVNKEPQAIADSDLKLIYRYAFYNCTALETVDLSNVKVITLDSEVFYGCTNLKEIINMKAIGTAYDSAFEGCTALASVDLTGMHVSGQNVFKDCVSLAVIETDKYTAIGKGMFRNCKGLTSLVIKSAIVGENAFENCTGLTSVRFEQAEEEVVIASDAFLNSGLKSVVFAPDCVVRAIGDRAFANTSLSSFSFPEGLVKWGANVFAGTITLREITLPASFNLEEIKLAGALFGDLTVNTAENSAYVMADGVLYNADQTTLLAVLGDMESVNIPSTVTNIYDYAFAGSKVTSVTIPASVTTIGNGAFKDSRLESIAFAANANLSVIADEAFYGSRLTEIVLPASVTKIGNYAFADTLLQKVAFNGDSIGAYAFMNCKYLKEITLGTNVSALGDYAFANCSSLTAVEIPAVKTMGVCVFMNASALVEAVFGNDAKTIGDYAFYGANSLERVTVGGQTGKIGAYAFYKCSSLTEVDIKNATEIGAYAFGECNMLSDVDLSKIVTVGDLAFYNCNGLTSLSLDSAKTVGYGAFAVDNGRGGSTSINIPVIETIGVAAFEGNDVSSILLPASLRSVGYAAFAYADSLTAYTVNEGNEIFFSEDGVLYRNTASGDYELVSYPTAKTSLDGSYTVIDGTVRVEAYAFAQLKEKALSKITLPYSIKALGDRAFYRSGITEYTFESINAPTLESVYNETAENIMEEHVDENAPLENPAVNGLYYANFNELFVYYGDVVGQTSELVMNYPTNGVGYDNYVYTKYFGTKNLTGIHMDDYTREFLDMVDGFESTDTLKLWKSTAESGDLETYRAAVESFSETVKRARLQYNNITDETQLGYVSDSYVKKLEDTENEMRSIKKQYGVTVNVSRLEYLDGSYKKDYVAGETFDMTGLTIFVIYDDGSRETADSSRLTLLTTRVLSIYDITVDVQYTDENGKTYTVFVKVSVSAAAKANAVKTEETAEAVGNDLTNVDLIVSDHGGNILPVAIAVVCGAVVILVAVICVIKKKS